uniref:Uncharacterized protein n=1 Tax=viral metagenome TaxID=1070528 RepID=A0A6C0I4B1_9ZZZZ
MEKIITLASLITFLFCILKMLEMRYSDEEEQRPIKQLALDATFVFICSFVGGFTYFRLDHSIGDFFNILTETKTLNPSVTQIFTDEPGF